ncbi:aldo/keto reductase [Gallaecimonas sp. GXIMD1310]|uniref:aldo/keto reductase n=1 Tax=Gallaecimonas sp. GXIMD1310 TaxID=3131926 RepID=UPI0032524D54
MQQRQLGKHGPMVSAMGLGCMGMSDFYGGRDEQEALATLDMALDSGLNFWDTADMYGPHTNEQLLAKALKGRREQVFLASKFGIIRDPNDPTKRGVNGHPDYVRKAIEGSLQRLGTDHLDLYYQHRLDPAVPVEETVGAMAELVKEGKVRYLGLSEVDSATLRRAYQVHPISAVQSEYSLWTRDPERVVMPACHELGVALVAYSPLGRGFLSGAIRSVDDFEADDFRRQNPRFQGQNFQRNLALVEAIKAMAEVRQVTPSQLALAWLLSRGEQVIPLFGTKRRRYLQDNLGALAIQLSADDLAELAAIFPADVAAGERYAPASMTLLPQ